MQHCHLTQAIRTAVRNKHDLVDALLAARPQLQEHNNASYVPAAFTFTQDEALWAVSMVRSRQFGLEFKGAYSHAQQQDFTSA